MTAPNSPCGFIRKYCRLGRLSANNAQVRTRRDGKARTSRTRRSRGDPPNGGRLTKNGFGLREYIPPIGKYKNAAALRPTLPFFCCRALRARRGSALPPAASLPRHLTASPLCGSRIRGSRKSPTGTRENPNSHSLPPGLHQVYKPFLRTNNITCCFQGS